MEVLIPSSCGTLIHQSEVASWHLSKKSQLLLQIFKWTFYNIVFIDHPEDGFEVITSRSSAKKRETKKG